MLAKSAHAGKILAASLATVGLDQVTGPRADPLDVGNFFRPVSRWRARLTSTMLPSSSVIATPIGKVRNKARYFSRLSTSATMHVLAALNFDFQSLICSA